MHFHNVIGLRKLDALRDKGFPFHDVPVDRRSIRVDRQGIYRAPFSQRISHITAMTSAVTIKLPKKNLTAWGLSPVGVLAPARNAIPAENSPTAATTTVNMMRQIKAAAVAEVVLARRQWLERRISLNYLPRSDQSRAATARKRLPLRCNWSAP